jgi:RNA-directed DNA polymerase
LCNEGNLALKLNESKSAVASVYGRKRLGYSLWETGKGEVKRRVADKVKVKFKQCVRQLTRRSSGRSMGQVVEKLRPYLLGWKAYFGLAQEPKVWRELDDWVRRRLRAIQLKHWRRGPTIHRELQALGHRSKWPDRWRAMPAGRWRNSGRALKSLLTSAYFDRLGVPRFS